MPRYWCSPGHLSISCWHLLSPWLRLDPLCRRRRPPPPRSSCFVYSWSPFKLPKNLSSPALFCTLLSFRQIMLTHCLWPAITGNCLKDMQLYVPEAVAVGDTVTLSCQYDLETVSADDTRSECASVDSWVELWWLRGGRCFYWPFLFVPLHHPPPPVHYYTVQDVLYLMRWTLDSAEFYRYVPKEEPAARSFNDVSGVIVDVIILYWMSVTSS